MTTLADTQEVQIVMPEARFFFLAPGCMILKGGGLYSVVASISSGLFLLSWP